MHKEDGKVCGINQVVHTVVRNSARAGRATGRGREEESMTMTGWN